MLFVSFYSFCLRLADVPPKAARRENLRDVWAQKSRRAETLLIMSSLMISGLYTLAVETPPEETWPALVVFYNVSLALSFLALFLCLFLCMKYQSRMSDFNIYKPQQVYTCNQTHESFESYYECHCSGPARLANFFFYIGTMLLLAAGALLFFARYFITFGNTVASSFYVGITGFSILVLVYVNWAMPVKTRAPNTASEAEDAENDARRMDEGRLGEGPAFLSFRRAGSGNLKRRRKHGKRFVEGSQSGEEVSSFRKYIHDLRISSPMSASVDPAAVPVAAASPTSDPLPPAFSSKRGREDEQDLGTYLTKETRRTLKQSLSVARNDLGKEEVSSSRPDVEMGEMV